MANTKITVDTGGAEKRIAVLKGAVSGLNGVVKGLGKTITEAFQIGGLTDFVGACMAAAAQTGDAAGAMYTSQLSGITNGFQALKTAIGGALLPMANAVLPGINAVISALTVLAQLAGQVTGTLFGKQAKAQGELAGSGEKAAEAAKHMGAATKSTASASKKAAGEMKRTIAAFDQLNRLEGDTGGAAAGAVLAPELPQQAALPAIDMDNNGMVLAFKGMADSIQQYYEGNLAVAVNGTIDGITQGITGLVQIFQGVWTDIVSLGEPLKAWFSDSFTLQLQTWILTWGDILGGLLDTVQLVFSDLWNIVIYPTLEKWAVDILPLLSEIWTQILLTVGTFFSSIKDLFDLLWSEGVAPALTLIMTIWSGLWDSVSAAWAEHGEPIFNGIRTLIENVAATLQNIWETVAKPVWDTFIDVVTQLWNEHLKPLWDNILDFVGSFAEMALTAYNNFILPIVNWLVDTFGPTFATVFSGILEIVGGIIGGVVDFISGLVETLTGVITFLTDVFTGNWEKAWDGLEKTFKGFINLLIGAVENFVNFFIRGINAVIGAANKLSFTAPDWLGGGTFGINIPKISELKLPRLASGAVIPPNREFMAVLGDQRSGTNLEAPEGLIRRIVREESGSSAIVPELREILTAIREGQVLMVDKRVLGETARDALASAARAGGTVFVPMR